MDTKREFLDLALKEGANRRELCRRFGISPKTGYELLKRHAVEGLAACVPRSKAPHTSPSKTPIAMESLVVQLRREHPAWGARKLARRLTDLGHEEVPPPSTINDILHRNNLVTAGASLAAQHWHRFEHGAPNDLWQMDFKGTFQTARGPCNPLTVLDDHSRFNIVLEARSGQGTRHVQPLLQAAFERYGMPLRINADNGAPWGSPSAGGGGFSELTVWLVRNGIRITHSRPFHPQTNGKLERFHRSLKAEVLDGWYANPEHAQEACVIWRDVYNTERPHEALGMDVPMSRYAMSQRAFPSTVPPVEYLPNDEIVTVRSDGVVRIKGTTIRVSKALYRLPIAVRPDPDNDGCYNLYFCHQRFMKLDLNA